MPRAGNDVDQRLEGVEPAGVVELGAHEHVLVGESHQRPVELRLGELAENGAALGGPGHRRQTHQYARRPSDALQRGEGETPELAVLPSGGQQHPRLGVLGEQPHRERVGAVSTHVGHFGHFSVGDRCAVLGFDVDSHALLVLLACCSPTDSPRGYPYSPINHPGRRANPQ